MRAGTWQTATDRERAASEASLAEALVATGMLSEETVRRAQEAARLTVTSLTRSLLELGLLEEERLQRFLADRLACPFIEEGAVPDAPLLESASDLSYLRRIRAVPVADREDGLLLAMAEPLDTTALEILAFHLGRPVLRAVTTSRIVETALSRYEGALAETAALDATAGGFASDEDIARLTTLANQAPVVRLVNELLTKALEQGASDMHIEPHETGMIVRLRVDGRLRDLERLPQQSFRAIASRIKIMARLDIAERRLPQDGRVRLTVRGREVDCRVSTIPIAYGESVVLRILDKRNLQVSLEELGFEPALRGRFDGILQNPNGIVLVTGPTGSGKTTTLYSCLRSMSSTDKKVFTVEDPIEYRLQGICQVQVHTQIDLTFANCLRSILRQDPDIVMVGEIRDAETAQIAVRAALTGHLVLSTLHTNSAASAVTRLVDMGIDRYLLAPTLQGILAQRLVRRPCPHCSSWTEVGPETPASVRACTPRIVKVGGCAACAGTGYAGRTAVVELLEIDEEVRSAILGAASETEIEEAGRRTGFSSLFDNGLEKLRRGETTLEELTTVVRGL